MQPKLTYIANVRLPTERAHGIQIVKTCEALARQGVAVTLLVPNRRNPISEDVVSFYKIEKNFSIKHLSCFDAISLAPWLGPIAYWIEAVTFAWSVRKACAAETIYTRDVSAIMFVKKNATIFYEAHTLPVTAGAFFKKLLHKVSGVVAISNGLKTDFEKIGYKNSKIIVVPDAVDTEMFTKIPGKSEARETLKLDRHKKIVVYTGHLYGWKGADTLAQSVNKLSADYDVYLVGGTVIDVAHFKRQYKAPNLHIVGWKNPSEIPFWLASADILVIPNSAASAIGSRYTSPLKAYEYLAANRPVVATDVPALREALAGSAAVTYAAPDDPTALAKAIQSVDIVKPVKNTAVFSWADRAQAILKFLHI